MKASLTLNPAAALRGPARPLAALALGNAALALSSYIAVPLVPVPVTMQTLAVTMVGALLGPRLGAATVALWLAEAAAGLPVLQGGAAGPGPFLGPTAGYIWAFPLAAALVGFLVGRGWGGRRPALAFTAMLLGNALCLAVGGAWLARLIGVPAAVSAGIVPFLLGGVLKSALGAAVLRALPAGGR